LVSNVPDTNAADGCHAVFKRFGNGIDNSSVELYRIENGGHAWPGAPPFAPNTNNDFEGSVAVWRFFRAYRMSQFTTNVGLKEHTNLHTVKVFPNPCSDELKLSGINNFRYRVFAADGRMILHGHAEEKIPVNSLLQGIYLLEVESDNSREVFRFARE
jgi:polyhydroxybutyrate depolymerase